MRAADEINREVRACPAGGAVRRRRPQNAAYTVRDAYEKWVTSPKFQLKRAATQQDYRHKARVLLAELGDEPLAAIAPRHLYAWWEAMHRQRGHAMANGVLAVTRVIFSHARRVGWLADNPARQLGIETLPPRVVVWSPSEIAAMVAAAEARGLHWLADAIVLALHTGQRQADVLAMTDPVVAGDRAILVRQAKRGARVSIPLTAPLAGRLADIRSRRASTSGVVDLAAARHLVLRPDGTRVPAMLLRKMLAVVRADVAATLPTVAVKTFADLRDTAVTRLALAGCTVAEIRAITGHTLATVHQVLEHYLALDDRMAQTAIARLQAWIAAEGIAL